MLRLILLVHGRKVKVAVEVALESWHKRAP